MKLGNVISAIGPGGVIVTGTVLALEPLKTRSGWVAVIDAPVEHAFLIRPEDEGRSWIYGDDEKQKDALLSASALHEVTKRVERRKVFKGKPLVQRKKRTV